MTRGLGFLLLAGVLLLVAVAVRDEAASSSGRSLRKQWASAGGITSAAPRHARAVAAGTARASRPDSVSGGPLSPCPGHSAYSSEYRWTNGRGVHRGCTTSYATWEYLSGGGTTACGEQLYDNQYTAAVSRNLPEFNRGAYVRCGTKALVCGSRCVVVRVNDRGPCNNPPSCTEDYSRDFDLSYAAAIRIGKSKAAWGDPVTTWWRACGLHTPAGSSRCSP